MPYASKAQERWAHTPSAKKAGFPTAEFDAASKGKKLPAKATSKTKKTKGSLFRKRGGK
jgi:hypothetical protein